MSKQNGAIVAIGGGEFALLGTLAIDKKIVSLARNAAPRALFIPTASSDSEGYWQTFKSVYGTELGCRTDSLFLLNGSLSAEEIEKKILGADIIYVGGGNTAKMMRVWRKLGVDRLLVEARSNGCVLAGLSAGAICWFSYGLSDSRKFSAGAGGAKFSFMKVKGLGLIPCIASPHHIREKDTREDGLDMLVAKDGGLGLAIDDDAALVVADGSYEIVTSKPDVGIKKVFKKKGVMVKEKVSERGTMKELLTRS